MTIVTAFVDVEVPRRGDIHGLREQLVLALPKLHRRMIEKCAASDGAPDALIPQGAAEVSISPDMFDPLWRLTATVPCLPEDESLLKGLLPHLVAQAIPAWSFVRLIDRVRP